MLLFALFASARMGVYQVMSSDVCRGCSIV